jgi:hypothetical protein
MKINYLQHENVNRTYHVLFHNVIPGGDENPGWGKSPRGVVPMYCCLYILQSNNQSVNGQQFYISILKTFLSQNIVVLIENIYRKTATGWKKYTSVYGTATSRMLARA